MGQSRFKLLVQVVRVGFQLGDVETQLFRLSVTLFDDLQNGLG